VRFTFGRAFSEAVAQENVRPSPGMNKQGSIAILGFGALLILLTGCGTFRWGHRDDLDDVTSTKERESHYWPAFKPDRDLNDPVWTP